MASSKVQLGHVLVFLSLMIVAGVFMLAGVFHRYNPSPFTNTTKTDFPHSTLSAGSYLLDFDSAAGTAAETKATIIRRGVGDRSAGELKSLHFDAFGHPSPSASPLNTSVTTNTPTTVASWSSTASLSAESTFKIMFTGTIAIISEASTTMHIAEVLPFMMATPIAAPSDQLRGGLFDGESFLTPSPTFPFPTVVLGGYGTSEADITSTAAISSVSIASSSVSPTTKHPGAVGFTIYASTELPASSASSAIITSTTLSSTGASGGYRGSTSVPTSITSNPSSEPILTSSTAKSSTTSSPTTMSHKEGQGFPPSSLPFESTALDPLDSLTAVATPISLIPTEGVPITALTSLFVAASSSSTVTTVAAVSSTNIPSTLTTPSTQISSTLPTSTPTSTPLAIPSSHSKTTQTIALSICLPIIIALLIFIAIWQRIRYREKKRADDLEKDVVWLTPRPHTPSSKNTTPRKPRTSNSTASTPTSLARSVDPAFLDGLNEVERAMVTEYQKKVAVVDARRAASRKRAAESLTSGRSPARSMQRPPGGPLNSHPPNLDGVGDAPLRRRPSQIFSQYHEHVLEPAMDATPVNLTPHNDHIRNALSYFQPSRLSTITDKSGEEQ